MTGAKGGCCLWRYTAIDLAQQNKPGTYNTRCPFTTEPITLLHVECRYITYLAQNQLVMASYFVNLLGWKENGSLLVARNKERLTTLRRLAGLSK